MKEIRDFLLENIPVPGQREYLHEMYETTNACEFVKSNMPRAWEPFGAAYLYMERIYQIPIGSTLVTEDILKLDAVRDQTVHAIDSAVDAQLKSPDPAMAAAARQLAQTKISFPVDTRSGYLSQTAQLDTYLAVMLGAQLENATKVGVLALVQNLKAVNDQIHELVKDRGEEYVDKGQDLSRPQARQQAINTWRTLIKYVNGYNLVILGATAPNEQLDRYIDTANEIGDRYRSIYLSGAGNKPAAGDGEGGSGSNGGSGSGSNTGGGTNEPTNPNEPSNPGGGTGGGENNTPGGGSTEDNRQEYQITYMDANNEDEFDIQMVKEGDPITPPTPPTGYHWVDVPATMPARNIYIRCAANA